MYINSSNSNTEFNQTGGNLFHNVLNASDKRYNGNTIINYKYQFGGDPPSDDKPSNNKPLDDTSPDMSSPDMSSPNDKPSNNKPSNSKPSNSKLIDQETDNITTDKPLPSTLSDIEVPSDNKPVIKPVNKSANEVDKPVNKSANEVDKPVIKSANEVDKPVIKPVIKPVNKSANETYKKFKADLTTIHNKKQNFWGHENVSAKIKFNVMASINSQPETTSEICIEGPLIYSIFKSIYNINKIPISLKHKLLSEHSDLIQLITLNAAKEPHATFAFASGTVEVKKKP